MLWGALQTLNLLISALSLKGGISRWFKNWKKDCYLWSLNPTGKIETLWNNWEKSCMVWKLLI